jgi:hypothetical protein
LGKTQKFIQLETWKGNNTEGKILQNNSLAKQFVIVLLNS